MANISLASLSLVGRWPASAADSDPHFASVTFLSSFDGTDGQTTYDNEGTGATPVVHGDAHLDAGQAKFGTTSMYFPLDDPTQSYLREAAGTLFNFGTSPFTIEGFFFFDAVLSASQTFEPILGNEDLATGTFPLHIDTPENRLYWDIKGGPNVYSPANSVAGQQWLYFALSGNGTTVRLRCEDKDNPGTTLLTKATFSAFTWPANEVFFGASDSPRRMGAPLYIDEWRITAGVDRYSTDDSLAVPTAPFPRE